MTDINKLYTFMRKTSMSDRYETDWTRTLEAKHTETNSKLAEEDIGELQDTAIEITQNTVQRTRKAEQSGRASVACGAESAELRCVRLEFPKKRKDSIWRKQYLEKQCWKMSTFDEDCKPWSSQTPNRVDKIILRSTESSYWKVSDEEKKVLKSSKKTCYRRANIRSVSSDQNLLPPADNCRV